MAAFALVLPAEVQIYEIDPAAVRDVRHRTALHRAYRKLRTRAIVTRDFYDSGTTAEPSQPTRNDRAPDDRPTRRSHTRRGPPRWARRTGGPGAARRLLEHVLAPWRDAPCVRAVVPEWPRLRRLARRTRLAVQRRGLARRSFRRPSAVPTWHCRERRRRRGVARRCRATPHSMSGSGFDLLRAVRDLPLPAPPPKLTAVDKLVLMYLAMRADAAGTSWPSHRTMADNTWLSTRSAQRSVHRLASAGLISVTPRRLAGSAERDSNVYTVLVRGIDSESPRIDPQSPRYRLSDTTCGDSQSPGIDSVAEEVPIEVINGSAHLSSAPPRGARRTTGSGSKRKPETTVPPSDAGAEDVETWCRRWGVPAPTSSNEAANFLDHARTHDRRARDWSGAWRTWQRKAAEFANTTRSRAPGQQPINEAASWYQAAS